MLDENTNTSNTQVSENTQNSNLIQSAVNHLSSKINVIQSQNLLIQDIDDALEQNQSTKTTLVDIQNQFKSSDAFGTERLDEIARTLADLDQTFAEIDGIEVIVDVAIAKVDRVDDALRATEAKYATATDPLFSHLPFVKK